MTVPAQYNFSGRDFSAEFERLLAILKVELPEYTDWNHSDAGIVLIRLLARETDLLNDYLDRVFAEGFIDTAWFRKSLIDLGMLVGYLPNLASAATVTLTLTRIDGAEGDIIIPQYSEFTRSDGMGYLTTEAVTIDSLEDSVSVGAKQGAIITNTYSIDEFTIDTKTGQYILDLGANVATGTIGITHGLDPVVDWVEVDSFYRSISTDNHFLLLVDGDTDHVMLTIGNGENGSIPPLDVDLIITYLRTDGSEGNIGAAMITNVPLAFMNYITSTNADVASGGASSESIDELRQQIPAVTRTQRRAVTVDDYIALIEKIPGVLDCLCVDRNTDDQWPHMYVVLYILPEGGGNISDELRETILGELQNWGHLGTWQGRYILLDPIEVAVNVTCSIGIIQGYVANTVLTAARAAITNEFSVDNIGIGSPLEFESIYDAVLGIDGVAWVNFTTPTSTITPGIGEIYTAGVLTVTQGT